MIYDLALKVKKGERVEMLIPHVGIFMVKNGIVAVAFDDNLLYTARVTLNNHLF